MANEDRADEESSRRREQADLAGVHRRLVARYSPLIDPEDVKRCVDEVAASFEGARVRTFIAVLVERKSAAQLRLALERSDRLALERSDRLAFEVVPSATAEAVPA